MRIFDNMKTKENEDERIVLQRLKFYKEIYFIIILVLFISMVIKQLVFHLSFSSYMTEFILIPSSAMYMLIRSYIAGENVQGNQKKSMNIIIVIIFILIFNGCYFIGMLMRGEFKQDMQSALLTLGITFISFSVLLSAISYVSYILFNKRSKKLEKKYDDD